MTKTVWVAAIAALAITPLIAKTGGRRGTNILHFNIKVPMVNDGNESTNASGTVAASQATQGNADKETVTVSAKGLTPNSPYDVLISTSTSGLTGQGGPFDTDRKGNLRLKLTTGKLGKGGVALSSNDVPVSTIQEVVIQDDSNSVPVLTADFGTNATSLQYLVKQDISTNSGDGTINTTATLNIKSTLNKGTSKSSVSVTASGLQAGAEYDLVFNGSVVATNAANSKGRLKISSTDTPPNILDLTSVDVTADSNGIPVTATATLP